MLVDNPLAALTGQIIGAAIEVHRVLGPGLLESTDEKCLAHELQRRGLEIEQQVSVPIQFKELVVEHACYMDLLVEGRVVVELKAVEQLTNAHRAQVLTYMKWADLSVGLLINFNEASLARGIRRLTRG